MSPLHQISPRWNASRLRDYLLSSLQMVGGEYANLVKASHRALSWYTHLHNRKGIRGLPFFFVLDLGQLLLQGDDFQFRLLSSRSRYRQINVLYAEKILNPLLSDPLFPKVHRLLSQNGDEEGLIHRALELILSPLLESRTLCHSLPEVNSLLLEDLHFPQPFHLEESWENIKEWLGREDLFEKALEEIISRTQNRGDYFLHETDLWELTHFPFLNSDSSRKIGRQITSLLTHLPPSTLDEIRTQRQREEVDTTAFQQGTYPQGGRFQITTRGSLENLVPSELVYLDEGQPVDLFSLRFVEGDLLYYERESSHSRGEKRDFHFFISRYDELSNHLFFPSRESEEARESYSYKYSVVTMSFLLSLMEDMEKLYPSSGCNYHLHLETSLLTWEEKIFQALLSLSLQKRFALTSHRDLSEVLASSLDSGKKICLISLEKDSRFPSSLPFFSLKKHFAQAGQNLLRKMADWKGELIARVLRE